MITYGDQILKIEDYAIHHDFYGRDTLSFYLPPGHEQCGDIRPLMSLHCRDDGQHYRIRKMDSGDVVAELDLTDLQAQMYTPYEGGPDTAAAIISAALPENWQVIDESGRSDAGSITMDSATPLEIIEAVCDQFGLAVRYDNSGIFQGKSWITLVDPAAYKTTPAYFTDELNLKSLATTVTTDGYATRLYAYGAEGISFAPINGGKPYVDASDQPEGAPVVSAYWQEDEITDPEELLEAARKKVEVLATPIASYELNVIDLAKTKPEEYGYLKVRLYDRVPLLDRESGRRTVHQVVTYTEYPNYPDRNEIVLSTEPQRIQQTVSRIKDTVESITRPDGTLVANKISGLINGANASLRAQYNEAERQDVLAILFENLDETSEMFGALAIGTQGILISKQRTADGKEWVWTTAISYAGIMADVIVSGRMQTKDGRFYIDLDKGESTATRLIGNAQFFDLFPEHTIETVIGQETVGEFPQQGLILKVDGKSRVALRGGNDIFTAGITFINEDGEDSGIYAQGKLLRLSAPFNGGQIDLLDNTYVYGMLKIWNSISVGKIKPSENFPDQAITVEGSLWVFEDLTVGGTKSRAVSTSEGQVCLSAYETAEPYFGDVGESKTDENGQARIDIDPLFEETVNTSCPYQVFLQPYCDGNFYVTERKTKYFIVKGVPNGAFGYEVKAKQRGYEQTRLEHISSHKQPSNHSRTCRFE